MLEKIHFALTQFVVKAESLQPADLDALCLCCKDAVSISKSDAIFIEARNSAEHAQAKLELQTVEASFAEALDMCEGGGGMERLNEVLRSADIPPGLVERLNGARDNLITEVMDALSRYGKPGETVCNAKYREHLKSIELLARDINKAR